MTAKNPIIEKIKKCLRMAMDQEGQPEGETAAKLAAKMMAAHQVKMEDIELDSEIAPDPIEEQKFDSPQSIWRRQLANVVAKHCQCTSAYTSYRGGMKIHLYGHRSDIEIAKYLYAICERQIETAARKYVSSLPDYEFMSRRFKTPKRQRGNEFRRSAVTGLANKLADIREEVKVENPTGTALVLCRGDKVQAWVDANRNLSAGRGSSYGHNSAGYAAGQNLNISAGLESK